MQLWNENLRRDLIEDSLPAPGRPHERWLFFSCSDVSADSDTGALCCRLCKACRSALSAVTGHEKKPKVEMPRMARANGMWRGPDPEELRRLSYTERKVINLARVYVSGKRIFLDRSSYARTNVREAPLYHQRNVVAYPQNPDAALRALGMSPTNLARVLHVQFIGEDRACIRSHADLQVSVENLRAVFQWLSLNSWPFMEATKDNDVWESDMLANGLEELLQQYTKSIGVVTGGVPAEIIQGATRISASEAGVSSAGPADCVAPEGVEADDEDVLCRPCDASVSKNVHSGGSQFSL